MKTKLLSWAHDLDAYPTYFENEAERDDCLRKVCSSRRRLNDFFRIEVLNTYDLYQKPVVGGALVKVDDPYVEPMPHASLSCEVYLHITGSAEWLERFANYAPALEHYEDDVYIPCNNHAERVLLAEHFAGQGYLELGGERRLVSRIGFTDRILVHDNTWSFRRSRVGTQSKVDRELGRQLRPLIEQLVNRQAKKAA